MLTFTEIYDDWDSRSFEEYAVDLFLAIRLKSTRNDFVWFVVIETDTFLEQLERCNENFRKTVSIAKALTESRSERNKKREKVK